MTSTRVRRRAAASALALAVLLTGCTRSVAGEAAPAPAVPSPVSGPTTTPSTFLTSPSSTSKFTTSKFATTPSASRTTTAAGTGTTPAPRTATTASRPPIEWKLPLPGPGHAPLNKYGNAVAKVGQSYGITWTKTKQYAVIFVIDSIKLDSGCDRPGKPAKAENGHFLVISVRLQVAMPPRTSWAMPVSGSTRTAGPLSTPRTWRRTRPARPAQPTVWHTTRECRTP